MSTLLRIPMCDLDAGLQRLPYPPRDIVVGKTESGVPFAMEDACPHSGSSLSKGQVVGEELVCPAHRFHLCTSSGAVTTRAGAGLCATVFPIRVEGTDVLIDLP